jgi:hypothetical protein
MSVTPRTLIGQASGHGGDHHVGFAQQGEREDVLELVVQGLLPDVARDQRRHDDRYGPLALAGALLYQLDEWTDYLPIGRGNNLERNPVVGPLPPTPCELAGIDVGLGRHVDARTLSLIELA